jgi:hypothetical protein
LGIDVLLEERCLLSHNLLWIGPPGGTWNGTNWVDLTTGQAGLPASPGDSLTFDPSRIAPDGTQGTDTNSTDNMGNFTITDLTIASNYDKTVTFNNALTATGNVNMANGTLSGGAPTLKVPNGSSVFTWSGGNIAANVTIGAANAHPTLTISGTASKTLSTGITFDSFASATWQGTGNIVMNNVANFTNDTGAVFDIQVDSSITQGAPTYAPSITNKGTFKKSLGAGTTTIAPAFTNTATVQFLSGTVHFTNADTQTAGTTTLNGGNFSADSGFDMSGGTLEGVGSITANVNVTGGTVHPGLGSAAGNLNIVGNYTQGANGTLVIDFNSGGGNGTLVVQKNSQTGTGGTATLGGTLTENRNGYTPTAGSFVFMVWVSPSGDFASDNLGTDSSTVSNVTYHFTKTKNATNYVFNVTH